MPMRAGRRRRLPPCEGHGRNSGRQCWLLEPQVSGLRDRRGDGELDCLVKGQMDGIGTRPRLAGGRARRKPLIDQSYPVEKVPDLPAATQETGDWLRKNPKGQSCRGRSSGRSWRARIQPPGSPDSRCCRQTRALCVARATASAATISRLSGRSWLAVPNCRRSHVSTPRSTATTARWRIISRYPRNFMTRAYDVMASTVFPTNTLPIVCVRSRPRPQRAA